MQPDFYDQQKRNMEAQSNAYGFSNSMSNLSSMLGSNAGNSMAAQSSRLIDELPERPLAPDAEFVDAEYVEPIKDAEWSIEGELKRLTPGKSDI